jgi:hypothetical protein
MIRILLALIVFSGAIMNLSADETENQLTWPREILNEEGSVTTLYQPQLESFENNILVGRMAVSVKVKDKDLVFGALWFSATLITDLDNRIAVLEGMDISRTHFPDADPEKVEEFARLLEEEIEGWGVEMSLDRLLASLEVAEVQKVQSNNLNNDPPVIHYRSHQAILVSIDGDPILQDSEEKDIQYVVNTPYFLVKDTKKETYYFKAHKWWYSTNEITTEWETTTKVPSKIQKLADKVIVDSEMENDSLLKTMKKTPEIIVSTVPAELITTDGEPQFVPVEGTSLLYVDNTENDIIMDISSQKYYILLAGRWFQSTSLVDGNWVFSEPGDLPDEFADIPQESPMAAVRTSVPGTEEAEIAVLEQTIPQTATVDRKTATVEVSYDGDPEFKPIEGTSMAYAINTDKSVLLVDGKYYCVDDGIWFESSSAKGPWAVSTERPEDVEEIPAESPVYNVKYVYIYDYTPEVVYVGYTPGYTCSYVYSGVVVYGTGYYYNPWYRHYYYPRYPTWGFGVHYNPWTGWGFSVSISFGRHYPRYGWGPRGYHHGYRRGYSHGYRHGYNRGYAHGAAHGYRAGQASASRNVYNNRGNGVQSTGRTQRQAAQMPAKRNQQSNVSRQNQQSNVNRQNQANTRNNANAVNNSGRYTRPSNQQNNVYTDRSGNVQKRDQNGNWQNRSNGQWQQQSGNRSQQNTQQMNRDHNARQQGAQRQNSYNQSRNTNVQRSSGTRSSGARPSGGGGRRR